MIPRKVILDELRKGNDENSRNSKGKAVENTKSSSSSGGVEQHKAAVMVSSKVDELGKGIGNSSISSNVIRVSKGKAVEDNKPSSSSGGVEQHKAAVMVSSKVDELGKGSGNSSISNNVIRVSKGKAVEDNKPSSSSGGVEQHKLPDSQLNEKREKRSVKTSKGEGANLYANLPSPKSSSANVDGDALFEERKELEALLEKSRLENEVGFSEEEVAADLATLSGPSSRGYCFCSKPWECERCAASILSLLERFPNSNSTYEELNKYATISKGMAKARITSEKELLLKWRGLSHNLMAELKVKLFHIYGIKAPPAFQFESKGSFKL